ncbi:CCDC90 family protein [Mycoavidus sp. HKI]|uniref:CCDC90 family protein n=1 Tax=Mycoavidus sp. HKI TaxID=2840467 RepID=UPI001CBD7FB5|nr:CCDC90 family protein [Mycoavidus sp. HKI]UAW63603.1 CCDC90 family protein [Mycoavidus sp. HKI]
MTAIPFDTLLFVETLTETGVDEKQAKAISTAVHDSYKMAGFVTKTDHRLFESSIRSDLDKLSIELRHEISDLRKDMNTRFAAVDAKLESLQLHLTLKISSIIGGILIAGLSALGIFMKALISANL